MQLNVETRIDGDLGVIEAKGEIDMASAGMLRQAVTDLLGNGVSRLVLDMTTVTFIDSTGLGILVGARKKLQHLQGSFSVVCQSPRILRLFNITGLAAALSVYPTYEDAVGALQSPANPEAR
ncbi:MAG: STAS domain-containing protein [Nocardioidaceae bacterium]